MKALRVTAIIIVILTSAYLLVLPFTYVVDPFDIGDERIGWRILPVIADLLLLLLGAVAVLKRRRFGWWVCQIVVVANILLWVQARNIFGVLPYLAVFAVFCTMPPWTWPERSGAIET